jgi:hypothetical protein
MKAGKRELVAMSAIAVVAGSLIAGTWLNLISFGSFPDRWVPGDYGDQMTYREALENYGLSESSIDQVLKSKPENFGNQTIGFDLLMLATQQTGASNAVTGILWDFRGYDTIGEATVIFVAVAGVVAVFRATKEE